MKSKTMTARLKKKVKSGERVVEVMKLNANVIKSSMGKAVNVVFICVCGCGQ